jgi:hypothetical protein
LKKVDYWEVKRKVEMLRRLAASKALPSKHLLLVKSIFHDVRISAITVKNDILYSPDGTKVLSCIHILMIYDILIAV